MSKWEKVMLSEACNINMGQSPSSDSYNQKGDGMPFYQGNADFGETYPVVRYYCNAPTKIAQLNDLLLSVRAPIGAINISDTTCCIGRGLCAITPKSHVEQKYIYHILKASNKELNLRGTGSTFKAINKQTLCDFEIPLPPLQEQRRIAKTLDATADLLRLHKQQLADLDAVVKSRFIEMFGDPVTNPMGWEVSRVGSVASSITAGECLNGDARKMEESEKAVLKVSAVTCGYFKPDEYKAIHNIGSIKKNIYPQKGDLLFSRANTREMVGATAIIFQDYPDLLLPDKLWKILLTDQVSIFYMKAVLSSGAIRSVMSALATGTSGSMFNISMGKLKEVLIPIPPITMQSQYAEFVQQVEASKALLQKSIDETQALFDSLMSEYFE